jgi:tryptophan-rich sensory protein
LDARLTRDWPLLLLIIAIVIGVGWLVGALIAPDASWVAELLMPPILIPQPISGIIQLVLSITFAMVGWRLWLLSPSVGLDMGLWAGTLILSWLFTPAFLALRQITAAEAIIVVMATMMTILTVRLWSHDRTSAWLNLPSTLWVIYTAVLTVWVVSLNSFPASAPAIG